MDALPATIIMKDIVGFLDIDSILSLFRTCGWIRRMCKEVDFMMEYPDSINMRELKHFPNLLNFFKLDLVDHSLMNKDVELLIAIAYQ
jgi:hypothetical protein